MINKFIIKLFKIYYIVMVILRFFIIVYKFVIEGFYKDLFFKFVWRLIGKYFIWMFCCIEFLMKKNEYIV